MKYKFFIAALMVCLICVDTAQAQRRGTVPPKMEDLPRLPLDTLDTASPDRKVVVYTNNTWDYYYPNLKRLISAEAFVNHWDTTQLFAYKDIELKDLPAVTELTLINSLEDYHYPIMGRVFSKYGPRGRRNHNGVDIPLHVGDPVYATFNGVIRYSNYNTGGFGNLVIIRNENGLESWYGHLVRRNVAVNQYVKAGDVIGYGGSTGRSRGPHLHYELRYCDQTFDPQRLIDFETGMLSYQTFALEKSFFNIYSRATDQLEDGDIDATLLASADSLDGVSSEDIVNNIEKQVQKPQPVEQDVVYHTIKSGDTLSHLAVKYHTTVKQICRLNNISTTTTLRLGRKLRMR